MDHTKLSRISVGRYGQPKEVGWLGCIEDEQRTWIAYIDLEGKPRFYLHRDPRTGAILDAPN